MDPEADPSQFSDQVSELALRSALNALKLVSPSYYLREMNVNVLPCMIRFAQIVLLVVEGKGSF